VFAGKAVFDVPKILLVEDDIDITGLCEVVWAFATRAPPEHGGKCTSPTCLLRAPGN
jgi:UbiD family decarboxylase